MGSISKSFSLLVIVLLVVSSLIMAKPAFAQTTTPAPSTIPTPSVPEFTTQLVGPSYTVPTTYSLDPNTGQIVAKIGYYDKYSYIVLTIKNQPFTSFNDNNGNQILFYYNVQTKGHNLNNSFVDLYNTNDGGNYPTQSTDSDYTNISMPIGEIPAGGTSIDIQVQAMIGYVGSKFKSGLLSGYVFVGQTSAWSSTQTVSIPASTPLSSTSTAPSATSTPTLTPVNSAPSSSTLLLITAIAFVVIVFLLAVIIFLLLYMRKRRIA